MTSIIRIYHDARPSECQILRYKQYLLHMIIMFSCIMHHACHEKKKTIFFMYILCKKKNSDNCSKNLHTSALQYNGHIPHANYVLPHHDVSQLSSINPINPKLNPICYLLALLAHHFLHVSRIRVKSLTLRLIMSYIYIYIYGAPILDVSRSHTTTQHSR